MAGHLILRILPFALTYASHQNITWRNWQAGAHGSLMYQSFLENGESVMYIKEANFENSGYKSSNLSNYPVMCHGNWTTVTFNEVKCPRFNDLDHKGEGRKKIGTVEHPLPNDGMRIKGLLCQKQKWVAECDETWYWSTTETSYIEPMDITDNDCLVALGKYELGTHVDTFFPPYSCYWNANNQNSEIFVSTFEHEVALDPYRNDYVDPLFIGGRCNQTICKTVHNNVLWIIKKDGEEDTTCNIRHWEKGDLYALTAEETLGDKPGEVVYTSFLESSIYGLRNTEGSCRMAICGKYGLRFSDGEWWAIQANVYSHFMIFFPECYSLRDKRSVTFHHLIHGQTKLERRESLREYRCFDFLSKLAARSPVSPLELSTIVPDRPGLGYAYRLSLDGFAPRYQGLVHPFNYKLERRTCLYQFINVPSPRSTFGENGSALIGYNHKGMPLYLHESLYYHNLTKINDSEVYGLMSEDGGSFQRELWLEFGRYTYSVNGIVTRNRTVFFPRESYLSNALDESLLIPVPLDLVQHPTIIHINEHDDPNRKILEIDQRLNRTDIIQETKNAIGRLVRKFSGWFKGWGNLVWWVVTGGIGLILTFIAYKTGLMTWFKRRILKNKKSASNEERTKSPDPELAENTYEDLENIPMRNHYFN